MAVTLQTSLGDIKIDLYCKERPNSTLNFLKLCKIKYYNSLTFYHVDRNFIAQSGDPEETGRGGASIFSKIYGEQARYFDKEKKPAMKHKSMGTVSLVNNGEGMLGSQFFITLGEDLDYLDETHCIIGQVVEGLDVLMKINDAICDNEKRPYQDIVIMHTIILDDPYDDPSGLEIPDKSPEYVPKQNRTRIGAFEKIDDTEGKTMEEIEESIKDKEAKARATILEMVGDIPDAQVKPPDNVLFVCKLNPVTKSDDLETIFSQFGKIISCEVIKDQKTGDSLQYAFIEFDRPDDCEKAYFKMNNVLIDDRRIHVDFSQSVSKLKFKRSNSQYRIKQTDHDLVFEDEKVGKLVDDVLNPTHKKRGNSPGRDHLERRQKREDRSPNKRSSSPRTTNRSRKRSSSSSNSDSPDPKALSRRQVSRSPHAPERREPYKSLRGQRNSRSPKNRSPYRRERNKRDSQSPRTRRRRSSSERDQRRKRYSRSPLRGSLEREQMRRRSPPARERRRSPPPRQRSPAARRSPPERRRQTSRSPFSWNHPPPRVSNRRRSVSRRSPLSREPRYLPRGSPLKSRGPQRSRSPRDPSPDRRRRCSISPRGRKPSPRARPRQDSSSPSPPRAPEKPRRRSSSSAEPHRPGARKPSPQRHRLPTSRYQRASPPLTRKKRDRSSSSSDSTRQGPGKKPEARVAKRKGSSSSDSSQSSSSDSDQKSSKKSTKKKRKSSSSSSSSSEASPVHKKSRRKKQKKKKQKKKHHKKKHTK